MAELKSELKIDIENSSFLKFGKIFPSKTKERRTSSRSFGDILESIKESGRDGLILSIISRKANLAYNITTDKCEKLISAGLIEEKILDRKKTYVITEKGLEFFQEYEKFQSLVEPLNLRY